MLRRQSELYIIRETLSTMYGKTLLYAKLFIFLTKFNKRYKKMVGMSFTEEKQNCVIVSSVAASFVRACTN